MKIITESEWQNLANAQDGNCGFFSSGDGSTTFRLPKVISLLKMSELAEVGNYNKSEYSNLHFHGLGRMQNNNGNWGVIAILVQSIPLVLLVGSGMDQVVLVPLADQIPVAISLHLII